MVFCPRSFEQVELYKARHVIEVGVAGQQMCSKSSSEPLATRNRFMAMNIPEISCEPSFPRSLPAATALPKNISRLSRCVPMFRFDRLRNPLCRYRRPI
jgi:hypothetical protein